MGTALLVLLLELLPACPARGWVTSEYGYRDHPITHRRRFHKGIDIGNEAGTPIRSPWTGRVLSVSRSRSAGLYVVVRSGPYRLLFAHLQAAEVAKGDHLERGERIGRMGRSGRTTGPHLHLAAWKGHRRIDPSVALWGCPVHD